MLLLARAGGGIVLQKHTSKMIYLSCIQLIIVRAAPVCGTQLTVFYYLEACMQIQEVYLSLSYPVSVGKRPNFQLLFISHHHDHHSCPQRQSDSNSSYIDYLWLSCYIFLIMEGSTSQLFWAEIKPTLSLLQVQDWNVKQPARIVKTRGMSAVFSAHK